MNAYRCLKCGFSTLARDGGSCPNMCGPLVRSDCSARIEKLLDAAFGVLAHDCDPLDIGSVEQRRSLRSKFEKILRVRTKE